MYLVKFVFGGAGRGQQIMKTLKYKTLRGYFRGRGHCNFELPEDVRQEIANGFASWLYATKGARRAEVTEGLVNGRGDLSLFQCFYLEVRPQGLRFSTSLSGEAHEFCKRKYLR